MNQTFVNDTVFLLADKIMKANYPYENAPFPVMGNDQMSRFFVSPLMELIIRHVFFLFMSRWIQNQANFYSNISQISYYMTPAWIENRYLFQTLSQYSTTFRHDLLYVDHTQVNNGDKWGLMIVNAINDSFSGTKDRLYPYVTDSVWIDWKVKNAGPDYIGNKKITVTTTAPGIMRYHKWVEDKAKSEYTHAVLRTVPF